VEREKDNFNSTVKKVREKHLLRNWLIRGLIIAMLFALYSYLENFYIDKKIENQKRISERSRKIEEASKIDKKKHCFQNCRFF